MTLHHDHVRFLWPALLVLLLALSASGCSPEARHGVLTFFFTGVPPLVDAEALAALEAEREAGQAVVQRGALLPRRWSGGAYIHGPYAAGECGACHELLPNPDPQVKSRRIIPGRFVAPPDQICVACHQEKSAQRAQADGLWLHGPADNCNRCHHPHSSQQSAMLRQTADKLCLTCHGDGFIFAADLHEGLEGCLSCHNPHLGRDALMLTMDYEEKF